MPIIYRLKSVAVFDSLHSYMKIQCLCFFDFTMLFHLVVPMLLTLSCIIKPTVSLF